MALTFILGVDRVRRQLPLVLQGAIFIVCYKTCNIKKDDGETDKDYINQHQNMARFVTYGKNIYRTHKTERKIDQTLGSALSGCVPSSYGFQDLGFGRSQ